MRKKLSKTQKKRNQYIKKEVQKALKHEKLKGKITYQQLKARVLAEMAANDITVKRAIKKIENKEAFTSAAERSRANFISGIRSKFKDEYNQLRSLSRNEKGAFKALKDNLVWDKDRKGYILNGKYFIDVTNSPEEVNIIEI